MSANKITAAEILAMSMSTARQVYIDGQTLIAVFKGEEPVAPWSDQLGHLFGEIPYDALERFMRESDISLDNVREVYEAMHPMWHNDRFTRFLQTGVWDDLNCTLMETEKK